MPSRPTDTTSTTRTSTGKVKDEATQQQVGTIDETENTWQFDPEVAEQYRHHSVGARDESQLEFGRGVALPCWEDHVHRLQRGRFFEELPTAGAQAFALHPHL